MTLRLYRAILVEIYALFPEILRFELVTLFVKHLNKMLLGALLEGRSSLRCSEPHWSFSALLAARHTPGYSTPFLITRCSPGCSMLPYHSALLDPLPLARIGTLLTSWCPSGSLSLSFLLAAIPTGRRDNDDSALSDDRSAPPEDC